MKKTFLFSAAALALVSLAACSGHQKQAGANCDRPDEVFTGVLPAADAAGIRYTLKLDYDDDSGNTRGDYDMLETYITNDTTKVSGMADANSFKSEGDFTVEEGTGVNKGKRYLKLVQDRRDSSPDATAGPLYFLIDSDSTITMVNQDLLPSETPGLNYTLKLAK